MNMKNIYTAVIGLFLALSLNVAAQSRVYAPDLRSPDNGDTGVTPDVLLDWDAVTGGTTDITYELQLDVTNDFANAVTFPTTDLTALQMSELLFGTTYYWHVRAYDGNEVSDWSETWSFSVTSSIILSSSVKGPSYTPTIKLPELILGNSLAFFLFKFMDKRFFILFSLSSFILRLYLNNLVTKLL